MTMGGHYFIGFGITRIQNYLDFIRLHLTLKKVHVTLSKNLTVKNPPFPASFYFEIQTIPVIALKQQMWQE